ncbi:MATE family efflux transporter [Gilvibacter sp.]|uniref:MATE family efflux transporter n=1 Tax=Gilvibacter sp. TaxID=2729997 RepID=UPI0025C1AE60|nr:MATE family efflux transporter [Gilvibacter sp.]NQX77807.1 oligosaccharide flippase family protein [Gilvibacter sp.]
MFSKLLQRFSKDGDIIELVRKGSSFFLIRAIGLLAGYGFTLFISNTYGAEVNGFVALSFSVFIIGSLLPRFGFDINLVKTFASHRIEVAKHIYLKVVSLSAIVSISLCLLGILLKDTVADWLNIEEPKYVIYGFIALPLWTIIHLNAGALRGLKKIKQFSFLTSGGRFIFAFLGLLICYYLLGFKDPYMPIIAHTAGLGVLTIYSFFSLFRSFNGVAAASEIKTKTYLIESYPLMFSLATILLLSWTDTIFLGIYRTSEEVGIYNVTFTLAALVSFTLHALNSILAPKIALSYKEKNMAVFDKLIQMTIKINFISSMIIVVGLVLLREFILGLFGQEFTAGATLLMILCIGQFSNSFCGPVGVVFQMTGKQKVFQNLVFVAFLINLALNFILIKPLGYYGAAISSIAGMAFWNFAGAYLVWKYFKIVLVFNPLSLFKK